MGKQVIPIFIDAALSDELFYNNIMNYILSFNISIFICSADIGDIVGFIESIYIYLYLLEYPLKLIYINVQAVGGEMCNTDIINGAISTSTYLQYASINFFKQYPNIIIIKCNTMYSNQAYNAFESITNDNNFNEIGVINLKGNDKTSSESAISDIERLCKDNCLIVNLCNSYYLKHFFIQYYMSTKLNANNNPILTFTLDERLIEDIGIEYCENHYIMSYYFNSMKDTEDSKEIRNVLNTVYMSENTVITSDMALCYSQIYLLKNTIEVVHSVDYDILRRYIFFPSSFPPPPISLYFLLFLYYRELQYSNYVGIGGELLWNNEGYSNSLVKLGKVKNDGSIELIDSSRYINPTHSYADYHNICDWRTGSILQQEIYRIVLLHIYNEDTKFNDKYYSEYFAVVVSLTNDMYNGINNHIIKGEEPFITSIQEMIDYIDEYGDDDEIIAFFGTSSYLFFSFVIVSFFFFNFYVL